MSRKAKLVVSKKDGSKQEVRVEVRTHVIDGNEYQEIVMLEPHTPEADETHMLVFGGDEA